MRYKPGNKIPCKKLKKRCRKICKTNGIRFTKAAFDQFKAGLTWKRINWCKICNCHAVAKSCKKTEKCGERTRRKICTDIDMPVPERDGQRIAKIEPLFLPRNDEKNEVLRSISCLDNNCLPQDLRRPSCIDISFELQNMNRSSNLFSSTQVQNLTGLNRIEQTSSGESRSFAQIGEPEVAPLQLTKQSSSTSEYSYDSGIDDDLDLDLDLFMGFLH